MRETEYYVYILASKRHGTLYVGVTNNIEMRLQQHRDGVVGSFVKKYSVYMLVYYESFTYVEDAILREKQIKKWRRDWKIRLIEEMNPWWDDLSSLWLEDGSPPARG